MVLQRGGERSCLKVIALKQGGFASKSGKSLDTQALGIAGDNVTGDAVTHFAKMGNGPGCARLSFVKRVMAQAAQSHLLRNG